MSGNETENGSTHTRMPEQPIPCVCVDHRRSVENLIRRLDKEGAGVHVDGEKLRQSMPNRLASELHCALRETTPTYTTSSSNGKLAVWRTEVDFRLPPASRPKLASALSARRNKVNKLIDAVNMRCAGSEVAKLAALPELTGLQAELLDIDKEIVERFTAAGFEESLDPRDEEIAELKMQLEAARARVAELEAARIVTPAPRMTPEELGIAVANLSDEENSRVSHAAVLEGVRLRKERRAEEAAAAEVEISTEPEPAESGTEIAAEPAAEPEPQSDDRVEVV